VGDPLPNSMKLALFYIVICGWWAGKVVYVR